MESREGEKHRPTKEQRQITRESVLRVLSLSAVLGPGHLNEELYCLRILPQRVSQKPC